MEIKNTISFGFEPNQNILYITLKAQKTYSRIYSGGLFLSSARHDWLLAIIIY